MTEPPAPDNWWLQRDGQLYGPYPLATLAFILRDGRARGEDFVGQSPEGPWQPLGELVVAIPPPPPVPVAVPAPPLTPPAPAARGHGRTWALGVAVFLAALIAVPVVTVGPQYREARTQAARQAAMDSLQQIGLALEVYAQQHDDLLPPSGRWEAGLKTILTKPGQLQNPGGAAYQFNESLAGKPLSAVRRSPDQELARDPLRYGNEFLLLQADGQVKAVRAAG